MFQGLLAGWCVLLVSACRPVAIDAVEVCCTLGWFGGYKGPLFADTVVEACRAAAVRQL
jgi:hypothetical protein